MIEEETLLAHTPIFDVVQDSEYAPGFRPVKVKSNDWVTIIVEKDGKFLMEKQHRFGIGKTVEEFPCGIVEDNETPVHAATRELEEETAIKVSESDLECVGSYAVNPAFMTNYMHYFYINLNDMKYETTFQKLDEHEQLSFFWKDKDFTVLEINGKSDGIPAMLGTAMWCLKRNNKI